MAGTIDLTLDAGVATLTINNPDQRNALTPAMLQSIAAHLGALQGDTSIRATVLRGQGPAFSSGYAIDQIPKGADLAEIDDIDVACRAIESSRLIVMALIQGPCVGAALEVASSCDFRFAERNSKLGITPVKLGLVYKWRGINRLYRLVGASHARELFLTGQLISGERAAEIGLVNGVYDDDAVEAGTYDYAAQFAVLAPKALAGNKRIFYELEQLTRVPEEIARELHELRCEVIDSRDAAEARQAFAEKRTPRFTGE